MKKIAISLGVLLAATPILALGQVTSSSTSSTISAQPKVACVQNALEKRESSLIAGHSTFNTSIITALTARKDGLKSAYALADKAATKSAKKTVWANFSTAQKNAHDAMRNVRKNSWTTFNSDMRACGVAHDEAPRATLNPSSSL